MRQAHDVAAAAADDASAGVIVFAAETAAEAAAVNAPPAGKQTCTNGRVHTIIGQEN